MKLSSNPLKCSKLFLFIVIVYSSNIILQIVCMASGMWLHLATGRLVPLKSSGYSISLAWASFYIMNWWTSSQCGARRHMIACQSMFWRRFSWVYHELGGCISYRAPHKTHMSEDKLHIQIKCTSCEHVLWFCSLKRNKWLASSCMSDEKTFLLTYLRTSGICYWSILIPCFYERCGEHYLSLMLCFTSCWVIGLENPVGKWWMKSLFIQLSLAISFIRL